MSVNIGCANAAPSRRRSEYLHARRVELNALSTEQLVDLVEGAIDEHGSEKVIPNTEDLAAAWRAAKAHAEIVKIIEKANRRAASRWQKAPTPDDLDDGSGS